MLEYRENDVLAKIHSVEHWYHRIEVAPGIVTPGVHDSPAALEMLGLPVRMDGMRVLDIGARDGFFSFAAEARGAHVLAIDAVAEEHLKGFAVAKEILGSSVEYRTMNVYDATPERIGRFDAIFFFGVLYHLRDPMLALDRLYSVANPGGLMWVESHTIDQGFSDPETGEMRTLEAVAPALKDVPIAQFYPGGALSGNPSNWWGPNLAALEAMVGSAGFEVLRSRVVGTRGILAARKVEDPEVGFWREFDRAEGTGEEGMAWAKKAYWSNPKRA